jgi:hypothetical protein
MGIAKDVLLDFIDGIPNDKLTGFRTNSGLIYKTRDYRLDNQGVS